MEAALERFGDELHAPLSRDREQWFTDGSPWLESGATWFGSFSEVGHAGEFPLAGMWTATDPPSEAIVEMVGSVGVRDRADLTMVATGATKRRGWLIFTGHSSGLGR